MQRLWEEAERHRKELVRRARFLLGCQDSAEDIVSECTFRCVQKCADPTALRAMLHVAVGRACIDRGRKKTQFDSWVSKALADGARARTECLWLNDQAARHQQGQLFAEAS